MNEINCYYCNKKFELSELAVSSTNGKLFCAPKQAPLEPNSCALRFIEEHPEESNQNYFFIKLEG